jgi:pimeloyl-ACP methyl ester carboxylesterase
MTYVQIDGQPMWIDEDDAAASAKPVLLLLHGGFGGSETDFGDALDLFRPTHRVVVFDRRGHGRTADTDEPFSFAAMAKEVAGVIEHLDAGPVRALGYSDGGNTLLHLALARPDSLLPAAVAALEPFTVDGGMLEAAYGEQSPDGVGHWPVVRDKGWTLTRSEPTFTAGDLQAITVPTLVLAADDDLFPLAATAAMAEAIPGAQLAVVPGTSHLMYMEKPDLVAAIVTGFFEAPSATRWLPIRV